METTNKQQTKPISVPFPGRVDAAARRTLDIAASAFGLLVLSPFFLVIAFLIKHDSPGPVFYYGMRLGKKGKLFKIVKFRTMYEKPASYEGPRITASGDSRITPLGHWLRDTKINELPQLWNVLVGEMSLVGPRPEDPEIAKAWPGSLRKDLLSVRPGITSPATVMFRHEEAMLLSTNVLDDYLKTILPDKLRLDRNYIRKRSMLTDLDVIFMTLLLLLPKLHKAKIPETVLYWGPIARFVSRHLNWFIIDTVTAFLAIGVSALSWRLGSPFHIGFANWVAISIVVALGFSIINSVLGLTRIQWRRAPSKEVIPLAFSSACATLILIFADSALLNSMHLPLAMLMSTGGLSFLGFAFTRYRERLLTGLASFWLVARKEKTTVGERVIIIGAGNNSQLAIWFLTHSEMARMFSIIGIVDDDPRKQGLYFDGFRVIGTSNDLPDLVEKYKVSLTIFTITNIEANERTRILRNCQMTETRVVIFPDVMTELTAYFQPNSEPDRAATTRYSGMEIGG